MLIGRATEPQSEALYHNPMYRGLSRKQLLELSSFVSQGENKAVVVSVVVSLCQYSLCYVFLGTFLARERVAALYQFVRQSLVDGWQPFELVVPGGRKLKEDEDVPLNECNLVRKQGAHKS